MTDLLLGPQWLIDDMVRVEELLVRTAGASEHPLVHEPALHLMRAGGKRLRPALVMISARSGSPAPSTDLAAAAIELVHLATLYHDDVIDQTEVRRGVPTTHARWGTEIAVLVGDYLFACGCGLGAEAGGEVPLILARAIAEVCEGQIVETDRLGDPLRPADDYLSTIRLKTAALFAAACELGACTSGASEARDALRSYGENLGFAFQIVDDLLDLVGDEAIIGKRPGTDLREGVFTLPVLLAARRDPSFASALIAGHRELEPALEALASTGALAQAEATAELYGQAAIAALDELAEDEWRLTLEKIAKGVLAQLPEGRL